MSKRPEITLVPVENLVIDPRYQRDLDKRRVRRIISRFRWDQFGILEVSYRTNDRFAVFDGQHRLAATKDLGIESVPCIVHTGLSAEEEAVLFTLLQTERKGLTQLDRFRAQVFAGDKDAVALNKIVLDLGLGFGKLSPSDDDGKTISAILNLERIYKRYGPKHLERTLREIKEVWDSDPGSMQGRFIGGMAHYLAFYGDHRYSEEIKNRLASVTPIVFIRRARVVHAGDERPGMAVYEQIRRVAKPRGAPRKFERSALIE